MVKISLRLDTRRRLSNGRCPLKISIARSGKTIYLPTNRSFYENEWDKKLSKVMPLRSNAAINNMLEGIRLDIERKVLELQDKGELRNFTDKQLIEYLSNNENSQAVQQLFSTQAASFLSLKSNKRTKEIYEVTLKHIARFCNYDTLRCDEITVGWLRDFEQYLKKPCPATNTRAIHLRNVRAIINYAIDNEVLETYSFRRFKIKTEATEKRALTAEEMRKMLHAEVTQTQRKYLDCFFLIFYLIGINIIDLSRLTKIEEGRVKYKRAKTGTLYDILVEPEAELIIRRYAGSRHLLRFFDTNTDYRNFEKKLNTNLTKVAYANGIKKAVTTYYARHTWASIAAQIDIPRDTISECLGHKYGSKVTAVYVDFDQKKKDDANRKVIDFLLEK